MMSHLRPGWDCAVHDVEAGKKTAHFETWLTIMQALDLTLIVIRKHPRSADGLGH